MLFMINACERMGAHSNLFNFGRRARVERAGSEKKGGEICACLQTDRMMMCCQGCGQEAKSLQKKSFREVVL